MSVRYYEKDRAIEDGVKIKGTNKTFKNLISEDCPWSKTSFNEDLDEFIEIVEGIESGYGIDIVQDINQMKIEYINDEVVIFGCVIEDTIKYFFLDKESYDGVSMPFKTFSSYLTIPVSFSKRNPGNLNEINFKYYQDKDDDVLIPIKIIYDKKVKEFDFTDKEDIERKISVYKIETLIKGKPKDLIETVDMQKEIPLLHRILNNIKEEIQDIDPGISIKLHSYVLGYDGFNKGRHFVRLVFEYGVKSVSVDDELYQFGLDIETDFSGNNKNAGTVFIVPILFRVVGETAFNIPFTKERFLKVMNSYIEDKIHKENLPSEEYDKKFNQYIEEFTVRFDEGCVYLKVCEANSNLKGIGFDRYIRNWIDLQEDIKDRLGKTKESIQSFRRTGDQFITDILLASKKLDFKAKEVIKYLILEYVAGVVSGDQVFESYLDIIHFLSMISLAYTTDIQREINQKVFQFVEILEGTKEYSIFNKYRDKLQTSFRENV